VVLSKDILNTDNTDLTNKPFDYNFGMGLANKMFVEFSLF